MPSFDELGTRILLSISAATLLIGSPTNQHVIISSPLNFSICNWNSLTRVLILVITSSSLNVLDAIATHLIKIGWLIFKIFKILEISGLCYDPAIYLLHLLSSSIQKSQSIPIFRVFWAFAVQACLRIFFLILLCKLTIVTLMEKIPSENTNYFSDPSLSPPWSSKLAIKDQSPLIQLWQPWLAKLIVGLSQKVLFTYHVSSRMVIDKGDHCW